MTRLKFWHSIVGFVIANAVSFIGILMFGGRTEPWVWLPIAIIQIIGFLMCGFLLGYINESIPKKEILFIVALSFLSGFKSVFGEDFGSSVGFVFFIKIVSATISLCFAFLGAFLGCKLKNKSINNNSSNFSLSNDMNEILQPKLGSKPSYWLSRIITMVIVLVLIALPIFAIGFNMKEKNETDEFNGLKKIIDTGVKSEEIANIIKGEKYYKFSDSLKRYIFEQENKLYTNEFIEYFNTQTKDLSNYMEKKDYQLIQDTETGKLRELTDQERNTLQYSNLPLTYTFTDEYLNLETNRPLKYCIVTSLLYFSIVANEDYTLIKEPLDSFFSNYIKIPKNAEFVKRDMTLDRLFLNTYTKFYNIDSIIEKGLEQLDSKRTQSMDYNSWPLSDVNDLIDYFGKVGTDVPESFYTLFNKSKLSYNPVRIYLAVKVMQKIGYDDPTLKILLDEDYYPNDKFEITSNGTTQEKIYISDEISKVKENIKNKPSTNMNILSVFGSYAGSFDSYHTEFMGGYMYVNAQMSFITKKIYLTICFVFLILLCIFLVFSKRDKNYGFLSIPAIAIMSAFIAFKCLGGYEESLHIFVLALFILASLVLTFIVYKLSNTHYSKVRSINEFLLNKVESISPHYSTTITTSRQDIPANNFTQKQNEFIAVDNYDKFPDEKIPHQEISNYETPNPKNIPTDEQLDMIYKNAASVNDDIRLKAIFDLYDIETEKAYYELIQNAGLDYRGEFRLAAIIALISKNNRDKVLELLKFWVNDFGNFTESGGNPKISMVLALAILENYDIMKAIDFVFDGKEQILMDLLKSDFNRAQERMDRMGFLLVWFLGIDGEGGNIAYIEKICTKFPQHQELINNVIKWMSMKL